MILLAFLMAADFLYALKTLFQSNLINASSYSTGCELFLWVDNITVMVSQGWKFIIILNLLLMLLRPTLYLKLSRSYSLLVFYNALVWGPPSIMCLVVQVRGNGKCTLNILGYLNVLQGGMASLIFAYWSVAFITIFIAFRVLRVGVSQVGHTAATRVVMYMVWFSLAFICVWAWTVVFVFLHSFLGKTPSAPVLVADTISFGLVGFINAVLCFSFSRKKEEVTSRTSSSVLLSDYSQPWVTSTIDSSLSSSVRANC
jgi:hypothetical protein